MKAFRGKKPSQLDAREQVEAVQMCIREMIEAGYMTLTDDVLRLTEKGWAASPEELDLLARSKDLEELEERDTE